MVMSRWDPFGDALSLRDAMNRLFENAVLQPSWWDGGQRSGSSEGFAPAMDVCETPDDYVVEMNLPGVRPEDVDIQLEQGVLTVRGEIKQDSHAGHHTGPQTSPQTSQQTGQMSQQAGQTSGQSRGQSGQQSGEHRGNYGIRERRWGRFYRSVTLPGNVDANRVDAKFEHGVLSIMIPKAEEMKPRRIQIQGQNRSQQIEGSATHLTGNTGRTNGGTKGTETGSQTGSTTQR